MNKIVLMLIGLSLAGCAGGPEDFSKVPLAEVASYPCVKVRPQLHWKLDTTAPYELEFGRGSGMCGLETEVIRPDGAVGVTRFLIGETSTDWKLSSKLTNTAPMWNKERFARAASTRFSPGAIKRIADAVVAYGLMESGDQYHADVHDGTQWVFWVRQNGQSKSIYFNNHFPDSIRRFATVLDQELESAPPSPWTPLSQKEFRASAHDLWDSI